MRQRDKNIIASLQQFRALTRDQVAELYFSHTKKKALNANDVLKRLRDRGYIEADTTRQPYVYFPKPARIKTNGQKVDHFLAIADVFLQMRGEELKHFTIESQFPGVEVRPDILAFWRGSAFFIEVQNTQYTTKVMQQKIARYEAFAQSELWRDCLPFRVKRFPVVWIIAPNKYAVQSEYVRIVQTKDVAELVHRQQPPQVQHPQQGVEVRFG
jgi:Replication-relaxation